jgi:hypothetical protein
MSGSGIVFPDCCWPLLLKNRGQSNKIFSEGKPQRTLHREKIGAGPRRLALANVIELTHAAFDADALRPQYRTVLGGPRVGAEIPLTQCSIAHARLPMNRVHERDGRAVTLRT